ncbi:tripartite motif-containing protein 2-like isoform X2 [Acanthaster planci]|uniref:Tripartite motif-containing protein 2-like isoform X2 n=1 Tax=Acanthaster planci TaxID=133434 RepID=A0A8B7ZXV3_ACAPL|nr:tripartite motif-containing protein 2-like isoform X2 [Acanthaster planci]
MAQAFDKIGQHFTCDICQDRYKQPKILDCVHSFCQACLEDYYTSRYKHARKIPCPVCRQETVLPDARIQGLKTNFPLMGIIAEISEQEKLARSEEKNKCQKHQGEMKRFYCETCQKLICSSCAVLDHCKPQHHYIDIGEASLKYKHSLIDKFSDFHKEIKGLEQSLAASSQAQREFGRNVTKTKKAVQDRAAKMRAEITTQENKLIDEIDQIQQHYNRMFDEHQKTVNMMLQGKQQSVTTAKDVTDTMSDSEFLSLYPIISKDLKSLKSQNPPKIDPKLSHLSFTPGQWMGAISLVPVDIAAIHNHDNQLVVVDGTKYVKVFDKKNKLALQFPTVPQSEVDKTEVDLQSVAVRKDGTILVGDVERMVWTEHRPTDGKILLHAIPVLTPPHFLAVDHCTDRVIVSSVDRQKVVVTASNGTTLATIKPTIDGQSVRVCSGVSCDKSGIYIAVCSRPGTGHIHHYDLDGVFLACLAQGLDSPYGITFTSDGQLAVADRFSIKMYHKV